MAGVDESGSSGTYTENPVRGRSLARQRIDTLEDALSGERLRTAHSPYLTLHAEDPVDWYTWGPEAFDEAAARGVPVFLSVGYSSCHWCHVMQRESFRDPETAEYLNDHS